MCGRLSIHAGAFARAGGRTHSRRGWHSGGGGAKGLVTCDLLIGGMGGEQEGRARGCGAGRQKLYYYFYNYTKNWHATYP